MPALDKNSRLVITGAAGLLGQNLVTELIGHGYTQITAIDKDAHNLDILASMQPRVKCVYADLSERGEWQKAFQGAARLFLLQAQITGQTFEPFQKNTLVSTSLVIEAAKAAQLPFTVFVGSSVVNSVADDNYTRSKKEQEKLVLESGLPFCIVRPTLMFGWFDPKHLGWLSRFMAKIPFFPIPGDGKYMRQPLYARDFCRVLIWCAINEPKDRIIDIVGQEKVDYIDIIRAIKKAKNLSTPIISLPVPLFRMLMNAYGLVSKNPPFVADQLDALMAGDFFTGDDMREFGVEPTPFAKAIEETFTHPVYSKVVLKRWH